MSSDDDDLLGPAPAPQKKLGRPSKADLEARDKQRQREIEAGLIASMQSPKGKPALGDPYAIHNGVNVTWLCQAFRTDVKTVRRKLAAIQPVGIGPRGVEVYDFAEAASYLAKPPADQLASFLRGLRVQDLPIQLQDPYWSAMRKRQIWMEHAGRLWTTEAVTEVLGDTFKTIKTTQQLWANTLDSQIGLTDEQRLLIRSLVDALQEKLHAALVEMPSLKSTGNMTTLPEANPEQALPPLADDDDEDPIG